MRIAPVSPVVRIVPTWNPPHRDLSRKPAGKPAAPTPAPSKRPASSDRKRDGF